MPKIPPHFTALLQALKFREPPLEALRSLTQFEWKDLLSRWEFARLTVPSGRSAVIKFFRSWFGRKSIDISRVTERGSSTSKRFTRILRTGSATPGQSMWFSTASRNGLVMCSILAFAGSPASICIAHLNRFSLRAMRFPGWATSHPTDQGTCAPILHLRWLRKAAPNRFRFSGMSSPRRWRVRECMLRALRLAFDYYSDDATTFAERSLHASAGVGGDAGRSRCRLKENWG
jgi:hypothetical protein